MSDSLTAMLHELRAEREQIGYTLRDPARREAFRAGYALAIEHVSSHLRDLAGVEVSTPARMVDLGGPFREAS